MSSTRAPLWSRDYVLALVVGFFLSMVFYLLMTTMALYAVDRFAAGDAQAGLASSMYVVGALVSRVWAGAAADTLGRRRVLLAGLALFVAASFSYPAADSLLLLLVVRFVHGVAFGAAHTAVSAIVQSLVPQSRRAEGTGYYGAAATLATAVGPLLAIVLVDRQGYPALFTATAVASVLAMGAALLLRAPQERRPPGDRLPARQALGSLVDPAALPIASVALVMGAAFSGILTFVSSYAQSLDLAAAAAAFFLVYAVVVLVTRLFAGRVQDVHGDDVVVYPAIVLLAGGMIALAATTGPVLLLVAGGLAGAGFGTFMSAGQAIAVSATAPVRVGRAVSTYFLLLDLGTGVGPILLGLVISTGGYRVMYAVLAGVVLLAAVLYRRVTR
ncbi:MFS transporter [Actinotalea sp. K2]|uniref:MFS transporter n=1 Tax=Actinotalea sp. K2 TaxID=2939438 RepID=UPI002016E1D1|nr:MFS transporter [Actinotalea sp. K2]MCL3862480.1 MFS transporter [Actinotalea sp. K2]